MSGEVERLPFIMQGSSLGDFFYFLSEKYYLSGFNTSLKQHDGVLLYDLRT